MEVFIRQGMINNHYVNVICLDGGIGVRHDRYISSIFV